MDTYENSTCKLRKETKTHAHDSQALKTDKRKKYLNNEETNTCKPF